MFGTTSIEGSTKLDTLSLKHGESKTLCIREDVAGKGIWDIENNIKLYKIKNLAAQSFDSLSLSLDLSFRKYWNGPTSEEGYGIYELMITDASFTLERQDSFLYILKSELPAPLIANIHLKDCDGVQHKPVSDTLYPNNSHKIGYIDIYDYKCPETNRDFYIEQKLSGIYSINITYNQITKKINLKKDTALFKVHDDSCVIVVSENYFK